MNFYKLIAAGAVFFALSASVSAQKKYLQDTEIPSQITEYVQNHFPGAAITRVKQEVKPLKTEYEVKLTPNAELEFDGDFNIKEIEVKAGIPADALPQNISRYVVENYPGAPVKEWKLETGGHKVKLLNGTKLYFDPEGTFVAQKNKRHR